MPLTPSVLTSIPPGISRPATVPLSLSGQGPAPAGPGQGVPTGPEGEPQEPDLFEKVVRLVMSNPGLWLPMLAGMGMREALEKTGKYVSKPHRSNEELAAAGYNTGIPGQTGQPSPDQMQRSVQPGLMPMPMSVPLIARALMRA